MKAAGFRILGHDDCPIAPVWLGKATISKAFMDGLFFDEDIYVQAIPYPVVPRGEARIRCVVSAAHTTE